MKGMLELVQLLDSVQLDFFFFMCLRVFDFLLPSRNGYNPTSSHCIAKSLFSAHLLLVI